MNEFIIELFIDSQDEKNKELSCLDEKEANQWKIDLEARALAEYYKRQIKIFKQKFDFIERY